MKRHMAVWRYRAKCVKKTDDMAAKRESRDCSQIEGMENGGHFGIEADEVPLVERTGEVEEEVPTEEAVPRFCLVFAESARQTVNRGAQIKVKNTSRLICEVNFDVGELCRHVMEIDDSKQTLDETRDGKLAEDGFTKKIVKNAIRSSFPGAVLFGRVVVAVLWRQMAISSSQDVPF